MDMEEYWNASLQNNIYKWNIVLVSFLKIRYISKAVLEVLTLGKLKVLV